MRNLKKEDSVLKKVLKYEPEEGVFSAAPLSLLFALLLQAAGIVWWASGQTRDAFFMAQRVSQIEETSSRTHENYVLIMERLARIEERENAQVSLLEHIQKQVGVSQR